MSNLFSLYSRNQYIDTILGETKNVSNPNEKLAQLLKLEENEAVTKEFQPPPKMFKRNPSSSPPGLLVESPWSTSSSPSSYPSPTSSPKITKHAHSFNEKHPLLKPDFSTSDENPPTSSVNQNSPIDLSIRSKENNEEEQTEKKVQCEEMVREEKYKISFVIDEVVKDSESSKSD